MFKLHRQYTSLILLHAHPLHGNIHTIFIIFIKTVENDAQCQSHASIKYSYWLEWQLLSNHPVFWWLDTEQHALALRPLTLPWSPALTQGHSCLWAGTISDQKLFCDAVLAAASSSPSWSSSECPCSLEHAATDMAALRWLAHMGCTCTQNTLTGLQSEG